MKERDPEVSIGRDGLQVFLEARDRHDMCEDIRLGHMQVSQTQASTLELRPGSSGV